MPPAWPSTEAALAGQSTGDLGGRAVGELLAGGNAVRALVRDGADASALATKGVQVARGDLLDPASLDRALEGGERRRSATRQVL